MGWPSCERSLEASCQHLPLKLGPEGLKRRRRGELMFFKPSLLVEVLELGRSFIFSCVDAALIFWFWTAWGWSAAQTAALFFMPLRGSSCSSACAAWPFGVARCGRFIVSYHFDPAVYSSS